MKVGAIPAKSAIANAGGGAGGGGGALIEDATTCVTLVSSVSPCATSSALKSPPSTAASIELAVMDVRPRSKNDTVYATYTAVCARVLASNITHD
jgi:hypothetical protein